MIVIDMLTFFFLNPKEVENQRVRRGDYTLFVLWAAFLPQHTLRTSHIHMHNALSTQHMMCIGDIRLIWWVNVSWWWIYDVCWDQCIFLLLCLVIIAIFLIITIIIMVKKYWILVIIEIIIINILHSLRLPQLTWCTNLRPGEISTVPSLNFAIFRQTEKG